MSTVYEGGEGTYSDQSGYNKVYVTVPTLSIIGSDTIKAFKYLRHRRYYSVGFFIYDEPVIEEAPTGDR